MWNIPSADYVQKLADARERLKLTAADASLQMSYDLLTPDMQKRWVALSVFPGALPLEVLRRFGTKRSPPHKKPLAN